MASKLDDFLTDNPSYKDWPQDQLLRSLHDKYYSDLPYDKFAKEITSAAPSDVAPIPDQTGGDKGVTIKEAPLPASDDDMPFYKRIGKGIERGALEGGADIINTAITPKNMGQDWLDPYLTAARDKLRGMEPAASRDDTVAQKVEDVGGEILGGVPAGVVEWTMGVPFAALHGVKTASDKAFQEGREPTAGEEVYDAFVEGLGRFVGGKVLERGMGRAPTALSLGGIQGAESISENRDPKRAAVDGGIAAVIGLLGPEISRASSMKLQAAREANAQGDDHATMKYLDSVLIEHSDKIAAAARNIGVEPKQEDEFERQRPSEQSQRLPTPENRKEIKQRAQSSLVTRIAHRERADALARARMTGWEKKFKGLSSRDRIELIAAYQRGGVENMPEQWRPFFRDFAQLLADQAEEERAAGFEYEHRLNYAPGYFEKPDKVRNFYETAPRASDTLSRKPGFTRGKGFEDYIEAVAAGYRPRVDNPAVMAAMRIEAGNQAIMRRQAMHDMVQDGLAVPLKEETEGLEGKVKEKRTQIRGRYLDRFVESGDARVINDVNADRREQGLPPVRGNLRHGGREYELTPEALVHLKNREEGVTAARLRPAQHRDWKTIDVLGERYLVHPLVKSWVERALAYDAQQFTDLLHLDREHPAARAERALGMVWMGIRNATIPIKLSISAFHANHVLGIDVAQPVAAVMTQALNKRMSPAQFIKAFEEGVAERDEHGRRAAEAFSRTDKDLTQLERLEQNLFLAGGFSPRMPSYYEIQAQRDFARTLDDVIPRLQQEAEQDGWSTLSRAWHVYPQYAKAAYLTLGSLIEKLQGPLFNRFIPQLKAASYLNEAKLILAHRPDLLDGTPEAAAKIRATLHDLARSIDNRFGEMQYDKVFMPSLVKRAAFSTFLSVGWNFGFIREFVGGLFLDLPKLALPSKEEKELTTRTVYASTYLFLGTVVAGMMTYILTGKPPQEPKDYVYPKLPDGSRLNTMFFNREFAATFYHVTQQGPMRGLEDLVEGKLSPAAQSLTEVLNNEDYFGNQVYDPNAPFWTQIAEASKHYASGAILPISLEGIEEKPAGSVAQAELGFAGFNPAAKYIDMTPTQARIRRAYDETHPQSVTPYAETGRLQELHDVKAHYKQWLKTNDPVERQAWTEGLRAYEKKYPQYLRKGVLKRSIKEWHLPDFATEFRELDRATQAAILREAPPQERKTFAPYAHRDLRAGLQ